MFRVTSTPGSRVSSTSLAIALVFITGGLLSVQAPLNGALSRGVGGPINGALISFLVGTAALSVVALGLRSAPDVGAVRALPWWAWCGGLCGAVFVAGAAWAVPKVGVATLLTLGVAGQLLMAIIIDHFGLLGVARQAITGGRLLGVALVLAGVVLVRRA